MSKVRLPGSKTAPTLPLVGILVFGEPLPTVRILIVGNIGASDSVRWIEAQCPLLALNFFCKSTRGLDVTVMLEELQDLCALSVLNAHKPRALSLPVSGSARSRLAVALCWPCCFLLALSGDGPR